MKQLFRFEEGEDGKLRNCDHYLDKMRLGLRGLFGEGVDFEVHHHPTKAAMIIDINGWRGTTSYEATPEDIYETYLEISKT